MIRNIREDSSESCVVVMKAISHCYWADRPQQLFDESAGAQVLLVREPDSVDPNAVRVHFRGAGGRVYFQHGCQASGSGYG